MLPSEARLLRKPKLAQRLSSASLQDGGKASMEGRVVQVKAFVPVRVQRPLADRCRLGLLAIDGGDGERIGETCVVSVNPVVRRVSQRRSARACTRRV